MEDGLGKSRSCAMRAYRGTDAGRVADGTVVLRRMIYQSRKIEAGELRGARYYTYYTHL